MCGFSLFLSVGPLGRLDSLNNYQGEYHQNNMCHMSVAGWWRGSAKKKKKKATATSLLYTTHIIYFVSGR